MGRLLVVMARAGAMVSARLADAVLPAESLTLKVSVVLDTAVGVPWRRPEAATNVIPLGSVPEVTDHE
jgi:hypothetical protein